LSVTVAYLLRFDFSIDDRYMTGLYITTVILVAIRIPLFYIFNLYNISWRHFGFKDTTQLINVVFFSTISLLAITYFLRFYNIVIPRSIIPIEFFISLFLMLALRISKRLYLERYKKNALGKYTLVIADLDKANDIVKRLNSYESNYFPVAIVSDIDDEIKLNGVKVYSYKSFQKSSIGYEAIIIDKDLDVKELLRELKIPLNCDIKLAVNYEEFNTALKDISVEDLLARHPKDLDKEKIKSFVYGKTILITGAGGSIGSEISRQCEKYGAKKLILLDHSEYNLYSISEELKSIEKVSVMQTVLDKTLLEETFKKYQPDIVIHAAAYKHVPLVEENIYEGILNNIIGTKNVIDTAIKHNVEKVVLISTDKAVRPTNVMGATKRVCELYAQNSNGNTTEIVAVRFGNVLGSSGSVIPKFQKQLEEGGPLTVTHPEITRYFMLISEACELVLQAGAIGKGGEIFILDMGEPVKIVDLAKKMLELSGREDIKIVYTGLRPGEKLYEELLLDESDASTEYESITIAKTTSYSLDKLNEDIKELLIVKDKLKKLKEMVPEFHHQKNS
jgi:UDP-N-acetyl-D-glucosamine 4,6-dehydratase